MFKKRPHIKALAPLRSSDRRKIADRIIHEFDVQVPAREVKGGQEDDVTAKPQSALAVGDIRNSLLPENALSARFTTTAGPELRQVSGTVYAGAHSGEEQRILWFSIEDRMIPTVYTLWRNPGLVPLLHTPDFVVQKLQTGSPLMTPGLANGPPFPAKATIGAVVAIASLQKPSVPLVVGTCEIDISQLQKVQGVKGHAVRSEHWQGDEIWAWSTSGSSGRSAPDDIKGWGDPEDDKTLSQAVERVEIEDEDNEEGGVSLTAAQVEKPKNEHVEGEPIEQANREPEKIWSTKDIDNAFWQAFLYGVYSAKKNNTNVPRHGLDFPVHQSLVISNLVLPYLPIHAPTDATSLNIKKTSWKNARKFIKALDKAKILKSKDRDGGECVVLDIDFDDQAIVTFQPYKLPKKATTGADSGDDGRGKAVAAGSTSNDSSVGQTLQLLTLYRPKESLSALFSMANANPRSLYTAAELRPIVTSYIESENLVTTTNKRQVQLNPLLANSVFDGKKPLDTEVINKGFVPRDALIDRVREACSSHYLLIRNEAPRDDTKAKSGKPPKVQIILETRTGNKTVTKVSGVEAFHLNPQLLGEELQKSCASSTSVGQLMGSSPRNPVMEILVQGPQKDNVFRALEKRGIHRQWIEVADKTKGKKKS